MKKYLYIGIGLVVLGAAAALMALPKENDGIACTLEAKQCPDGSYVGRTGPRCEFTACPTSSVGVVAQSGNMKVYAPAPGETVQSPIVMIGEGRTFENSVVFRLISLDETTELAKGFSTLLAPDVGQFGPFSAALEFPVSAAGQSAILEVFEYSAKDGSIINNVRIPVTLGSQRLQTVKAFFSNNKTDPGATQCERVYPVMRAIPQTITVARAALEQLFAGPTAAEKLAGYYTSINEGVRINSLAVAGTVAKLDLSNELTQAVGGSCRVMAIAAQIEQTLTQFSSIKSLQLSVNGQAEPLQP